jgi:hypothetical protein
LLARPIVSQQLCGPLGGFICIFVAEYTCVRFDLIYSNGLATALHLLQDGHQHMFVFVVTHAHRFHHHVPELVHARCTISGYVCAILQRLMDGCTFSSCNSISRAFTTGVDVQQCAVCMLVIMWGGIGGSAASYAQLLWCLVGDEQACPNQLAGRW